MLGNINKVYSEGCCMSMTKAYAKITAEMLSSMEKKDRINFLEKMPDSDRDKVIDALEAIGIKDNQK